MVLDPMLSQGTLTQDTGTVQPNNGNGDHGPGFHCWVKRTFARIVLEVRLHGADGVVLYYTSYHNMHRPLICILKQTAHVWF